MNAYFCNVYGLRSFLLKKSFPEFAKQLLQPSSPPLLFPKCPLNQLLANLHGAQNLLIYYNPWLMFLKISSFLVDYRVQYQSLVSKKFSLETKLNAFTVQETFVDKGIISEMNFKTGSAKDPSCYMRNPPKFPLPK